MVGAMGKDEKESFGRSYHIWGSCTVLICGGKCPICFFLSWRGLAFYRCYLDACIIPHRTGVLALWLELRGVCSGDYTIDNSIIS
jgi:hypothetical protein